MRNLVDSAHLTRRDRRNIVLKQMMIVPHLMDFFTTRTIFRFEYGRNLGVGALVPKYQQRCRSRMGQVALTVALVCTDFWAF